MATHEFGHATGFRGHFDNNERTYRLCDNNADMHTMCSTINQGEARMRTLQYHDKETFVNAYPPR